MAVDVFSVPVFFVVLREAVEAAIVVSVLLAFLKQTLDGPDKNPAAYKFLAKQVWLGAALGLGLCLAIGTGVIATFYTVGKDVWGPAENYYEGAFYLVAAIIITIISPALLRIGKMQQKWRVKMADALRAPVDTSNHRGAVGKFLRKYAIFALAFFTVAREGMEGIIFISGVSFSAKATSVPLPVVVGLIAGCLIGWLMYRGASAANMKIFLVLSTCLLFLVAAGLFSRAIWYFEQGHWNALVGADVAELGVGPGSYDIDRSVWHVNCCSPEFEGGYGWGIFNGILGWTNSATYSTVIGYNLYWIAVMALLGSMRYKEVKGHWPLVGRKLRPAVGTAQ